jgi:hypothetical protein
MADDAPTPPEAPPLTGIEKRKRNLLPPCQPGETRNREGKNGRDKRKVIIDFMEKMDPKDPHQRTRIQCFLESVYLRSRTGNGTCVKWLGDQFFGKAAVRVDLSNEDGSLQPLRTDAILSALQAAIAARKNDAEGGAGHGQGGHW